MLPNRINALALFGAVLYLDALMAFVFHSLQWPMALVVIFSLATIAFLGVAWFVSKKT